MPLAHQVKHENAILIGGRDMSRPYETSINVGRDKAHLVRKLSTNADHNAITTEYIYPISCTVTLPLQ